MLEMPRAAWGSLTGQMFFCLCCGIPKEVYSVNTKSSPFQKNSLLPDENNVARLQEELKAMKLRESEAMKSFRELQQQVKELNDNWQVCYS